VTFNPCNRKNALAMKEYDNEYTFESLTDRKKEILRLIGEGLSTKMIASQLLVSFETIKSHRKNILMKLNASNITEALCLAMKFSLLD